MEVIEQQLDRRVLLYQQKMTAEMLRHLYAGDALVMQWNLSAAANQYERAQEIARYHLHRDDMVEWLGSRLKNVAESYLLADREDRRLPGLDGLDL